MTNAESPNSRDARSFAAPIRDGRFRDAHRPSEPAPKIGSWEEIGPSECPIMYRRTLLDLGKHVGKVLWHEFMPNASDEAHHDHPRSFLTIVLRGGYDDVREDGLVDHVYAPTIRFRRATHAHITKVGPDGRNYSSPARATLRQLPARRHPDRTDSPARGRTAIGGAAAVYRLSAPRVRHGGQRMGSVDR